MKFSGQPGKVSSRDQSGVGVGKQQGRFEKEVETKTSPVVFQLMQWPLILITSLDHIRFNNRLLVVGNYCGLVESRNVLHGKVVGIIDFWVLILCFFYNFTGNMGFMLWWFYSKIWHLQDLILGISHNLISYSRQSSDVSFCAMNVCASDVVHKYLFTAYYT